MRRHVLKTMFGSVTALVLLIPIAATLESRVTDLGQTRMVVETTSAFERRDTLAFRFAGRVPAQSPDPKRLVFHGDLTSLATGEVVGKFTWDLTCRQAVGAPCIVYEVTNTFRLPEGTLVSRDVATAMPDAAHPGFFLLGIHPDGNSIIEATGAFAGRTGRAKMSGRHDGREVPAFVSFDDFWLIELDPKR